MTDRRPSALERPVLNPAFVAVQSAEDEVSIRAGPWSAPITTVRETEEGESIESLFEMLDGEHELEAILQRYDDDDRQAIRALLGGLRERNVVFDAAAVEGDIVRPQLAVASRFDGAEDSRIDGASALVVGVGELGVQVADDLVRSGVGSVRLVRPVAGETPSEPDPTGVLDRLRDDATFVETTDDLRSELDRADAAILASDTDRPAVVSTFNEFAAAAGTPWMLAQVRGFDGLVGPVVFPGETACYRCLERRIGANLSDGGAYASYRDGIASDASQTSVGLPSFARAVAGLATVDFLYLLAYGQAFTVGRTMTVDFLTLSTEVNEVLKAPRCDVCGKTTGEDVKRHVSVDDLVGSGIQFDTGGE
jgi:bacteriocin biosynthesis cyclodehydratase domain-containing protein